MEVKLAVFGVYTLLRKFGIVEASSLGSVTMEHLKRLKEKQEEVGEERLQFEIYFSRKNCSMCAKFVRRLAEAAGVDIRLCWRDRLMLKEYQKRKHKTYKEWEQAIADSAKKRDGAVDLDDTEDDNDDIVLLSDDEDIEILSQTSYIRSDSEVVDLTTRRRSASLDEIIEVEDTQRDQVNNNESNDNGHPLDHYCDGLAYCVGQMQSDPGVAKQAILVFARDMTKSWNSDKERSIKKPLPATAESEPPA